MFRKPVKAVEHAKRTVTWDKVPSAHAGAVDEPHYIHTYSSITPLSNMQVMTFIRTVNLTRIRPEMSEDVPVSAT